MTNEELINIWCDADARVKSLIHADKMISLATILLWAAALLIGEEANYDRQ